MLLQYFAALTFVCSVSAASLRDDPYYPYRSGSYALAGAPMAGAYAGAGAGAGVFGPGFPFAAWSGIPWTYPVMPPIMPPIIPPIPVITFPVPWYERENVCNETYVSKEQNTEGKPAWADILRDNNYQQSSRSCRGDDTTYVCKEEKQTPKGRVVVYTKYECCFGFVNAPPDSRCVESPKESSDGSTAVPPTSKSNTISDYNRYEIHQDSSSSVQESGVESVPAQ